uniref:CclI n=1 Tax=Carnobacterium maltaromaticum TaxID=2751 RepID=E1U2S0_CARML|nr:CclI [Carnobacterium maltaromaticum]
MTLLNYIFGFVMLGYGIHQYLKYQTMYVKTNKKKYKLISLIFIVAVVCIILGSILRLLNL